MTGKQRAYLRGLANSIPAKYQIGKEGIVENHQKLIDDALEANELIKISVLETVEETPRQICDKLVKMLNAEPIQVIGRKIVLYRESKNNKQIEIPK